MSGIIQTPHNVPKRLPFEATRILAKTKKTAKNVVNQLNIPKRRRDGTYRDIRQSNRFQSFAPERDGNTVKWFIDGHDYLWAISEVLDSAKQQICILDWWLSPETYLRRPPELFPEWRLDVLLKRKADQGVTVNIIVYNEIPGISSMDSEHTQEALEKLSQNIRVMRHPDHSIFSEESVYFWSHHEKLVIVDNTYVAIGGMDLCFGRFDTHNHPLSNARPSQFNRTLFPGQDNNNSRIKDYEDLSNYQTTTLPVLQYARMPWHDVHVMMLGPSAVDAAAHFVERWNYIKNKKYSTNQRYPLLTLPLQVFPNLPNVRHPMWQEWQKNQVDQVQASELTVNQTMKPSCKVQFCRSVTEWSQNVPTEASIYNAYIQLIKEAKHFIYIENQFFISNAATGQTVVNQIAAALVERIIQAAKSGQKFKVIVVLPEVPDLSGTIKDTKSLQYLLGAEWRTINRGGSSVMERIRAAGYNPDDYISFFHLRVYDRINGPKSWIQSVETKTGVTFQQAQLALDGVWSDAGIPGAGTTNAPNTNPQVAGNAPVAQQDAPNSIKKFESGSSEADKKISDNVGQHALQADSRLQDEKWHGKDEEQKECYITELCYIHSKLMIVDDLRVVIGSANINDRSLNGDQDSELVIIVEDTDMITSQMDGQPYQAARFAATLRRELFKEHLGLIKPQDCTPENANIVSSFMTPVPNPPTDTTGGPEDALVVDPLSDQLLNLWNSTAKNNTDILLEIYKTVPNNQVKNWDEYNAYVPTGVETGHVAANLSTSQLVERLGQVKGHLTQGAISFLNEENGLTEGLSWTTWPFGNLLIIYT
ncbi:phospholipase D/nuclease [Serendipita vermifera]|nr:phospholipase D/nuclease [Serendipita vermifera]